jgi:hypothetical protein
MSILQLFNKTNDLGYQTAILRYRLLPSILSSLLLLTLLVSFQAGAALTPSPIIVDNLVKVSFSEFEFNRRSNTFDVRAKLSNRSVTPISTPIRLVIKNIKPNTVALANATGLLPDGSPYVDVSLSENDDDEHSSDEKIKNALFKFNSPKWAKFTFDYSVLGHAICQSKLFAE